MTLKQARKQFKELYKADKNDKIKTNLEYSLFLDSLNKDGLLTEKQVFNAANFYKH